MNFLIKILLTAVAVLIIAFVLPGVEVDGYYTALWVAITLGLIFTFLKPILVVLTLPATILTFGLFLFILNAGLVLLADAWVDGFRVAGFWTALFFSVLLSIVESILHSMVNINR